MPRVSVVIPTYNRADLVGRSIDSVLAQTHRDYEIIVVDDGSTDDTQGVLARYGDRIRIIVQDNAGVAKARNTGALASNGEFVNFLDSDDTLLPRKLESHVDYLDSHPEVDVVLCGWRNIEEETGALLNEVTSLPVDDLLRAILLRGNYGLLPMHPALLRRRCLERVGLFDESLLMREDQDFWMRVALSGCGIGQIEQALCEYHNRAGGKGKNWARLERTMPVLLAKVFNHPQLPASIAAMKDEVYARSALEFGLYYYAESDGHAGPAMASARRYFEEAFGLWPDILLQHTPYRESILYTVVQEAPDAPQTRLRSDLDLLLPDTPRRHRIRAVLLSELYVILAFQAYEAGQRSRVLAHALAAIRHAPAALRDRGLRAITAKALLGVRPGDGALHDVVPGDAE